MQFPFPFAEKAAPAQEALEILSLSHALDLQRQDMVRRCFVLFLLLLLFVLKRAFLRVVVSIVAACVRVLFAGFVAMVTAVVMIRCDPAR